MADVSDEELYDYNPEQLATGTYFTPSNCFASRLHASIANRDISTVKRLIRKGGELNLTDNRGYTALHLAVEYESIDIIKVLLAQPGIRYNAQNHIGETPLFLSLERQLDEVASVLIYHGCDINIPNYENVTPLHLAVRGKSTKIGHMLILKGADINCKDQDGYTPLHDAATKNQFDNVCMLLYYNASANEKTTFSEATPFHMICNYHCATETAEYLLNYVVDIDELDSSGSTALHLALNSRSNLAMNIIKAGANVDVLIAGTPCIYFSFFYETSSVFETMWHQIDCNVLLDLRYPFLQAFIKNCKFPNDQFVKCLFMIFDSPFIDEFLHQHISNQEKSLFTSIAHKKLSLDQRIKINYLFLSYGVPVYFNDICLLHDMYNLNEDVELILTSGCCIEPNCVNRFNLLISRICYDHIEIYTRGKDYFTSCIFQSDKKYYSKFYTLPEYNDSYVNNKIVSTKIWRNVRSLLELSRDAVRAAVYKTCNKSYTFGAYNAFIALQVPTKIRNILFLKEPLYPERKMEKCIC